MRSIKTGAVGSGRAEVWESVIREEGLQDAPSALGILEQDSVLEAFSLRV